MSTNQNRSSLRAMQYSPSVSSSFACPRGGLWNANRFVVPSLLSLRPQFDGFVAGIDVKWEVGVPLFFDDSYDHCVWNHTNKDRVVLLFDIWYERFTHFPPSVTPVGILILFPKKLRRLSRCSKRLRSRGRAGCGRQQEDHRLIK